MLLNLVTSQFLFKYFIIVTKLLLKNIQVSSFCQI